MDDSWSYWADKYGRIDALKTYYPEQAKDPVIAFAIAQIEAGELAIDARMDQLKKLNPTS